MVLSLGWLLLYATRTALSSALKDIGDFWSLSQSYLGFLSSSFFIAYTVLQVPAGFLADKLGSRRVLLAGFGVQAAGLILGALARNPGQFLLSRVLTGSGQATYYACQQAIISFTLPPERRGIGTAATMGGSAIGGAAGFILGKILSTGTLGWRFPFVVLGLMSAAYIGAVLLFVPEPHVVSGDRIEAKAYDSARHHLLTGGSSGGVSRSASSGLRKTPLSLLIPLSASHFLSMYGFYVMLTWLPYYLETVRGIKGVLSGVIPIVMPLIMAPSTVICGAIADKKEGNKDLILKVAMPVAAVSTILMPLSRSIWGLVLCLAFYGASGKLVIDPELVATVGDNSPVQSRNTVLAIYNFWGALAMAVAPAVTGFLASMAGSFDVSFYVAGIFNLIGLGTFLLGTHIFRRQERGKTHCVDQESSV